MSRKLLIVNQNSGYLTIDVANAFKKQYDEVVVMFGANRVTDRTFHPEINIQRTITYDRSSNLRRLWTWGICTLHLFFLLQWKYRGYSVLYYTNPPMSYFNALFFSNPFGIVVFDSYPNALKLIGINESSFIYRLWVIINKRVFKKAKKIITLSQGMRKELSEYIDEMNVTVVPVWSASDSFKPVPKKENSFLEKHQWQDKFIVLYSGNMGVGHKLEVLIEVAERLKQNPEILFLFIGEGAKSTRLKQLAEVKNLPNVIFLTWQNADVLPYSLAAGDIAVVALEPEATNASVPSKTFNYMAVGAPLLGIGSAGSELEDIIKKSNLGLYADGFSSIEIAEFINKLYVDNHIAKVLSANSYEESSKFHHTRSENYVF